MSDAATGRPCGAFRPAGGRDGSEVAPVDARPDAAPRRIHGGPGADGPARWDFSTCANAAGPCPAVLDALRAADPTHYPDPGYHALRRRLAAFHDVDPDRVVFGASASELIQRLTAVGARLAPGPVALPAQAYGDYAAAAHAAGRGRVAADDARATLRWVAEPASPTGADAAPPTDPGATPTVLDAVYAPLRLVGTSRWRDADRDAAFVLHGPNKALALCGIRGTYAIAPLPRRVGYDVDAWRAALAAAEPSWPLGAHAVAMLEAWTEPAVQRWLAQSRRSLEAWLAGLRETLAARGFTLRDSVANFVCVRPPPGAPDATALRRHGVAVRDTTSFGLPGQWRVSAQPPAALQALREALDRG